MMAKLNYCVLAFTVSTLFTSLAEAGSIVGGSNILDAASESQLESWLGEGSLTLTNIFSHTNGDGLTSLDFHNASDYMGRTFSLMDVAVYDSSSGNYLEKIIGGYDPQSWENFNAYHLNDPYSNGERTAFIFNLTDSLLFKQDLINVNSQFGERGFFQTYNHLDYGPTFGGGYDLYSSSDLNAGYTFGYSYTNNDDNLYGQFGSLINAAGTQGFLINKLEIFTIAAVPEPDSYVLLLVGLSFVGFAANRKRQIFCV